VPSDWRSAFLYEYFKEGQYASPTVLAARTKTHKLITYPDHDEWTEVFDLANDPYETKNLVDDAELVDKLQEILVEQSQAVAFRMPENIGKEGDQSGPRQRKNRRRPAQRRTALPLEK
jgi:hypothetical protein